MTQDIDSLIEELVDNLDPVRPMRLKAGLALAATTLATIVLLTAHAKGIWLNGLSGEASKFYFFSMALFIMVGAVASANVIAVANPAVGKRFHPPVWVHSIIAILPLTAILLMIMDKVGMKALIDAQGVTCFINIMATSVVITVVLMFWLRRGAPVSPQLTGILTGIAATAFASAIYGLSCDHDTAAHIGFWHAAPILFGAILGRFILPPLLKW